MVDRQKVIKGLKLISEWLFQQYHVVYDGDAPNYYDAYKTVDDAVTLLKEQQETIASHQGTIRKLIDALEERGWNLLTEDSNGFLHGLPGDDGQYLMTDGKDIWIDDYVDGVADGIILDSGKDIREIVAWMYMPELPKKDRK